MKAEKKYLTDQIEAILDDGISKMEEIDITSEWLIKLIWPFFEYYENQNKEQIEVLRKSVEIIKIWHGKDGFDIYFNNAPEMKPIRSILGNYSQEARKASTNQIKFNVPL